MLQSSSPRLTASHKVAGSTSKVGKRFVGIVDPPKGSATIGFILAQLFGGFGAGPANRDGRGRPPRRPLHRCHYARLKRRPEMDAQRLATLESDNIPAIAGRDLGAVLGTVYLGAQTGGENGNKTKRRQIYRV